MRMHLNRFRSKNMKRAKRLSKAREELRTQETLRIFKEIADERRARHITSYVGPPTSQTGDDK